ncbi:MAG: HU family DNA-binding protein [Oscillatoriales cyanobacterium RM2_1_1]|nr:HU family DNA-binding protein [Oscillatoriales cyanobacterium SM2_3_0]NJO45931.1 HU family DNA-binding protein [Oscillatoriales cyanobacterium RM2_1_1]
MNKQELVRAVAAKTGLNLKQSDTAITALCETIIEAVSNGDSAKILGFGTFEARERKEREGRNPSTGETMTIPATTVPAFSAGKMFKDAVAEKQKTAA